MDFEKVAGEIIGKYIDLSDLTNAPVAAQMQSDIASALRTAAEVPEGHVMLPGGKVVRVLGTLPMTADGCVMCPGTPVWASDHGGPTQVVMDTEVWRQEGHRTRSWDSCDCYSTRSAAESALAPNDNRS